MPRGDKSAYTDKQKRKAEHIEESYESRGVSEKEAERRAWATVNKQDWGAAKKRIRKRKEGHQRRGEKGRQGRRRCRCLETRPRLVRHPPRRRLRPEESRQIVLSA